MPRNGKLVRIALVVAATAAVAVVAVATAGSASARSKGTLNGAGSSLVAPAVAQWASMYSADTVNYSAIGSGGGIQAISLMQRHRVQADQRVQVGAAAIVCLDAVEVSARDCGRCDVARQIGGVQAGDGQLFDGRRV